MTKARPLHALLLLPFLFPFLTGTTIAQCIQSPPGLIHWWPGDGSPADIAGANPVIPHNGVPYAGKVGSAMVFDGVDDAVVSSQNSTLTGNPSFTIEGWLFVPSSATITSPFAYPPLLWWGQATAGRSVFFGLNSSNRNKLYTGFFNGGQRMVGTFTNDEWHHVAWVREGGGAANQGNTLYIDGVSVPLEDDPALPSNSLVPDLAASPYDIQEATEGRFFECMVDELAVYDRVLSAQEVEAIFAAGDDGKCKPGAIPGLIPSQCTPSPSGLLSWWPGDGNTTDIAGSNSGIPQGGVSFTAKVGSAFVFNGINDYLVSAEDSTLTGNPSFTLEVWIYVPTSPRITASAGYPPILWWGSPSNGRSVFFGLHSNVPNKLYVGFYAGGQRMVNTFTNDEWHHVAWVREGGGAANQGNTLYIDGVSVALEDDPLLPANSLTPVLDASPYYIQSAGDSRFFQCMIDEIGIYDRALAEGEVQAIFNAGGDGKCKSTYELFGTGCPGTAGVPTLAVTKAFPWVDKAFAVELGNLPSGSGVAYVIFGFSNTNWAGIPLPGDLTLLGLPGCTVYVGVEVAIPVLVTGGKAQLAFQIPPNPSLEGLVFYNQAVALDPPANFFGGIVTNAGVGVIGRR